METFIPSGIFRWKRFDSGKERQMDILKQLSDYARIRTENRKKEVSMEEMKQLALDTPLPAKPSLEEILRKPGMRFICECKKASPSKGLIDPEFPYLEIAREYESAGADAISCLTEPKWFLGKDAYLKEIAETVSLPVLRKDFTVDPYMIYEARALGASAVLLIKAILSDAELAEYLELTRSIGLSALVEAHDETEVDAAVNAGASIIGVNNRNLRDFTVDIRNSIRLRNRVPESILMVAESGIRTREDIIRMEQAGISGVLIGETLMKAKDKRNMLKELKGEYA